MTQTESTREQRMFHALRRRIFWNPPMNADEFSQKPGEHFCSWLSPLAPGL
jgi:hypothetical protein